MEELAWVWWLIAESKGDLEGAAYKRGTRGLFLFRAILMQFFLEKISSKAK